MSYDVWVLSAAAEGDVERVVGRLEDGDLDAAPPDPSVLRFRGAVLDLRPELAEVMEPEGTADGADRYVALHIPWDTEPAVVERVLELARELGLLVHDPQEETEAAAPARPRRGLLGRLLGRG